MAIQRGMLLDIHVGERKLSDTEALVHQFDRHVVVGFETPEGYSKLS